MGVGKGRKGKMEMGNGFDQSTLHAGMKLSNNK